MGIPTHLAFSLPPLPAPFIKRCSQLHSFPQPPTAPSLGENSELRTFSKRLHSPLGVVYTPHSRPEREERVPCFPSRNPQIAPAAVAQILSGPDGAAPKNSSFTIFSPPALIAARIATSAFSAPAAPAPIPPSTSPATSTPAPPDSECRRRTLVRPALAPMDVGCPIRRFLRVGPKNIILNKYLTHYGIHATIRRDPHPYERPGRTFPFWESSEPRIAESPLFLPFLFISLRTLPSYVSCNPFACHSYENCRCVYKQFPFWNPSLIPLT